MATPPRHQQRPQQGSAQRPGTPAAAAAAQPRLLQIIACVILGLIVLVGLAVLITWLVVKPKKLVYTIEDRSIKNFVLKNDHLNSSFDFIISARNPNKRVSVYYDSIEVSVGYAHQTLAFNALSPFYQPKRNITRLEAKLEARDVALPSPNYSKKLKDEKESGDVELDVRIKARIRFKVGAIKLRHSTLRILCSPVLVRFSSATYERASCDLDF